MVAPSGMMDGMVQAIRQGLDAAGHARCRSCPTPPNSPAAITARFARRPRARPLWRPPQLSDGSRQPDEAIREVALDLAEGADIIMVKPALAYLDIICRVKETSGVPVAAYNVSGEYAMVKAAAAKGWIDERRIVLETLTAMKRAGADMILTYHAFDVARWLGEG